MLAVRRGRGWSAERTLQGLERVVIDTGSTLSRSSAAFHPVFTRTQEIAVEAIATYYGADPKDRNVR